MRETAWQIEHRAALHRRLDPLQDLPDGTVSSTSAGQHRVEVVKDGGQLHLYFRDPASGDLRGPMSRMEIRRPLHLVADYAQAIMLALLWRPEPRRACVLGMAGGRLSLVLYHHFPELRLDNVDVDPAVVEVASGYFGLTYDERQTIAVRDARAYVEALPPDVRYDVVIMDAFSDDRDNLDRLATRQFYAACRAHLEPGAPLAANLLFADARFHAKLKTFRGCFRHVYVAPHPHGLVLLGNDRRPLTADAIGRQALALAEAHSFDFPFAERAATLRPFRELDNAVREGLHEAPVLEDGEVT